MRCCEVVLFVIILFAALIRCLLGGLFRPGSGFATAEHFSFICFQSSVSSPTLKTTVIKADFFCFVGSL